MKVSNPDLFGTAAGRSHWEREKQVCLVPSVSKIDFKCKKLSTLHFWKITGFKKPSSVFDGNLVTMYLDFQVDATGFKNEIFSSYTRKIDFVLDFFRSSFNMYHRRNLDMHILKNCEKVAMTPISNLGMISNGTYEKFRIQTQI